MPRMDDTDRMALILAVLKNVEPSSGPMTARMITNVARQLSVVDVSRLLMDLRRLGYVAEVRPLWYSITPEGRKRK